MKDLYIIDWIGERDGEELKNKVYVISSSWESAKNKITKVLSKSNIKIKRLYLVENKVVYEAE